MFYAAALTVALTCATTNPWPPHGIVMVRLIAVLTVQPVASSDVRVLSENGVRCIRGPCPTDPVEWRGRTDSRGYVAVPATALNRVTSVRTPLHAGGRLTPDSPRDAEGARIVEVFPASLDSGGPLDLGVEAFKLIDARSGKPIANTPVQLIFRKKDSVELKTNALGYVFIPGEKVVAALDDVSATARGYLVRIERR